MNTRYRWPATWSLLALLFWSATGSCIAGAAVHTPADPPPPAAFGSLAATNGIPAGYKVIEGDILVPITTEFGIEGTWATNLWPNGIVPYEFDTNVGAADQAAMQNAMLDWEMVTNGVVLFRLRNPSDGNWVHIRDSNSDPQPSNSSMVGVQGGQQIINIAAWSWEFVMAHELGHCLGLWHEQSRPNRDSFVQIVLANVSQTACNGSCAHNFDLHSEAGQYPRNGYDYDSIMHYGQCAFTTVPSCPSGGGQTILVKPAGRPCPSPTNPNRLCQDAIGQSDHLSDLDRLTMSFLYPLDDWRFVDNTYPGSTENGTFLAPYKTFPAGVNATPAGGTLWITEQGEFAAAGTYAVPITIRAALGGVDLR